MSRPLLLLLSVSLISAGPALARQGAPAPPPPATGSAASAPTAAAVPGPLEEGDAHWALRGEGSTTGEAPGANISKAVASYRKALEARPDSLEARWRLMRAIYFLGEHATPAAEEKKKVFDEGKRIGEDALGLIRKRAAEVARKPMEKAGPVEIASVLKGDRDVMACFYWAAVDWGKWSLVFGKTAAVKQGAAAKIRDYSQAVIAMDPAFEDGGGYRVLGRLHHQTPSVPFLTGWASRGEALKNLRLSVQTSPKNFINRLYLAEAMWDYEKERRSEARSTLEALTAETPGTAYPVEDRRAQEDAKALLRAWGPR